MEKRIEKTIIPLLAFDEYVKEIAKRVNKENIDIILEGLRLLAMADLTGKKLVMVDRKTESANEIAISKLLGRDEDTNDDRGRWEDGFQG